MLWVGGFVRAGSIFWPLHLPSQYLHLPLCEERGTEPGKRDREREESSLPFEIRSFGHHFERPPKEKHGLELAERRLATNVCSLPKIRQLLQAWGGTNRESGRGREREREKKMKKMIAFATKSEQSF